MYMDICLQLTIDYYYYYNYTCNTDSSVSIAEVFCHIML